MSGEILQSDSGSTHVCWNQSVLLDSNKHFASYFAAVSVLFYILVLVKNLDYYFDDSTMHGKIQTVPWL